MNIPKCPTCKSNLIWQGVNLVCPVCSIEGNAKSIAFFFKTLGAEYITDKTIEKLGATTIEQVLEMEEDDMMESEGIGYAKAEQIVTQIHKCLTTTPDKLLAAFGIPSIGVENAKIVLAKVKCFDDLFFLKEGETGLGPKTEEKFLEGISDYNDLWIYLVEKELVIFRESTNQLKGHTFAITGTLPVKRDDVVRIIETNGGLFNKTVSGKTQYLVVGDNKNLTVKMMAAQAKGTKIITYDELMTMVG